MIHRKLLNRSPSNLPDAIVYDSTAGTVTITAHLIPGAHDTYRIGTTSTPNWSDVYVAGVVGPADP